MCTSAFRHINVDASPEMKPTFTICLKLQSKRRQKQPLISLVILWFDICHYKRKLRHFCLLFSYKTVFSACVWESVKTSYSNKIILFKPLKFFNFFPLYSWWIERISAKNSSIANESTESVDIRTTCRKQAVNKSKLEIKADEIPYD